MSWVFVPPEASQTFFTPPSPPNMEVVHWPAAKTVRAFDLGFFSKAPMPGNLVSDVVVKPIIRPQILKLGNTQIGAETAEGFSRLPMVWKPKNVVYKGTKPKAMAKPIKKDMSLPLKRGIYALETATCSETVGVAKPSQKNVK